MNNRFLASDLFVGQLTCTPGHKVVDYAPNSHFKGISGNFRIIGEIRVNADAGDSLKGAPSDFEAAHARNPKLKGGKSLSWNR